MRYGSDRSTLYTEIGERIMLARRRSALTQRDLGRKLGISHVAVGDIERGRTKPNLDNLAVIADALDVPLSQLVVLNGRAPQVGGWVPRAEVEKIVLDLMDPPKEGE